MQGFRNYNVEALQQREQQQIVVDLMPPQYTKQTTPPPSPNSGEFLPTVLFDSWWLTVKTFRGF